MVARKRPYLDPAHAERLKASRRHRRPSSTVSPAEVFPELPPRINVLGDLFGARNVRPLRRGANPPGYALPSVGRET